MEEYKYDVFISYSRKDTPIVNKICDAFDNNSITYFIDRQSIHGGLEFPKRLADGILDSQIFLFVASENSYRSSFTQSEVVFAYKYKKKDNIIPYIIDKSSLPKELELTFSAINWRRRSEHPIETVLVDDVLSKVRKERIQPPPESSTWDVLKQKKNIIIGILCILGVLGVVLAKIIVSPTPPDEDKSHQPVAVADTLNPEKKIKKKTVKDSIVSNPVLGVYKYSGPIDDDSQPHGRGKARFLNDDIYEGEFNHGTFEGTATYTYTVGDCFVGTFRNNAFYEGTYSLKNGEFFHGFFRDGQPDLTTGKWSK